MEDMMHERGLELAQVNSPVSGAFKEPVAKAGPAVTPKFVLRSQWLYKLGYKVMLASIKSCWRCLSHVPGQELEEALHAVAGRRLHHIVCGRALKGPVMKNNELN